MKILTKPLLKRLYVDLEKSDNEIASFLGLNRTTVVRARERFGIKARLSVGRKGEIAALRELDKLGFRALDMNEIDKLSEFDILVNDNLKIEVKSASEHRGRFCYVLSEKPEIGHVVSDKRIRLPSGRTRKLYSKTCDFLLLVGLSKDKAPSFWIIPSKDIPDDLQTLSVSISKRGKYAKYFNRFDLLGKPHERSEIA